MRQRPPAFASAERHTARLRRHVAEEMKYRVAARVNYAGNEYTIVTPWLSDRARVERELEEAEAARERGSEATFQRPWIAVREAFILETRIEEATAEEAERLGGPPEHIMDREPPPGD
jgi:hypothetical protein